MDKKGRLFYSMWSIILGVDPGIAATGFCAVIAPAKLRSIAPVRLPHVVQILATGVVRTKVNRKLLKTVDRANRVQEIARALMSFRLVACLKKPAGFLGEPNVIWACETFQVGKQKVSNAGIQTLGVYGAVIGLAVAHADMFLPVEPSASKKAVTGKGASSKDDVYRVRGVDLYALRVAGYHWPPSCNEHVGDAFAAAIVALRTLAGSPLFFS